MQQQASNEKKKVSWKISGTHIKCSRTMNKRTQIQATVNNGGLFAFFCKKRKCPKFCGQWNCVLLLNWRCEQCVCVCDSKWYKKMAKSGWRKKKLKLKHKSNYEFVILGSILVLYRHVREKNHERKIIFEFEKKRKKNGNNTKKQHNARDLYYY